MKKIILTFIIAGIFISNSFAQKTVTAPGEVSTSFAKKYPQIKPSWTFVDTNYVASFKFEGNETKAVFSQNGTWLETATPISSKELPGTVSEFINKTFFTDPSNILFKIKDTYLKETPAGMIYYVSVKEIGIEGLIEMTFKSNGTVISTSDQQGESFNKGEYNPKNITAVKTVAPANQKKEKVKEEKVKKEEEFTVNTKKPPATTKPSASSKPSNIPEEVSTSFAKKYPQAKPIWNVVDTNYVASFKLDGNDAKATFSADGKWIETATPISSKELPGATSEFIKKTFFNDPSNILFKIKDTYLKEKPSGMSYYVSVKEIGIDGLIEMTFKTTGGVISTSDQQGASFDNGDYSPKNKTAIKTVAPTNKQEEEVTVNTKKTEDLTFKPKSVIPKSLPYPVTYYLDTTLSPNNYTIKDAFMMKSSSGNNIFFVNVIKKGETAVQNTYFTFKGYHIENPDSVPKSSDSIIYNISPKTVAEANAKELKKAELLKKKELEEKANTEKAKAEELKKQKEEKEIADKEKAEELKKQKEEKEIADKAKAEELKKQKEEKEIADKAKAEELKKQKEEKEIADKAKAEEAKKMKEQKAEEAKRLKEEKEKAEKAKYKTTDNSTPEEILKSVKETEVPPKVIANLKKKFKNPEFIKWFSLGNNYVGMFKIPKAIDNDTTKAEYTPDGIWVKTHTEMDPNNLPDLVYGYINTNFKKQKIVKARHVVTAIRDDYYQVKLSKKEDQYTTIISEAIVDKMGKPYKKKSDKKPATTTKPTTTTPKPQTTKPADNTKKPITNPNNLPVDTALGIIYDTSSVPIQTPIVNDTLPMQKPKPATKPTPKPKTVPKK
ncbi:MAG: PepSY-like domain-containing protein [Bacteroidales bacterium]|nr:PepSY-like domain-containing protein [Bacteroidales bacterium]